MYRDKRECILKNNVCVQILIYHTSNLIIKSKFFEVVRDFRDINLSEKCVKASCCIELISDMSKEGYINPQVEKVCDVFGYVYRQDLVTWLSDIVKSAK